MFRLVKRLIRSSPAIRRRLTGLGYELMSRHWPDDRVTMMNYGYAALEGDGHTLELAPEQEFVRFQLQLYAHVADLGDLAGKQVLEVGCGRGGGARLLRERYAPAELTGMDVAASGIEFCRRVHALEGLDFVQGDAEDIPFQDDRFDVVVNVESSHCYGSMARFLGEVARVLRPGGVLLLADVRDRDQAGDFRRDMQAFGASELHEEDITAHVIAALDRNHAEKEELLTEIPFMLRNLFRDHIAAPGGVVDRAFRSGERVYLCFRARPGEGGERG